MSLARRLRSMPPPGGSGPIFQTEFIAPGTYDFKVPVGVNYLDAVGISAGWPGQYIPSYPGGQGGDLHWKNQIPVTPGEVLTVIVGKGQGRVTADKPTALKRGSTFLIRADGTGALYWPVLGGGGGRGGSGGPATDMDGGLGGGGPGYMGDGGSGGTTGAFSGGFPAPNSGGGRGGDTDGIPTGWAGNDGEGTGLLGRTTDKSGSLGAARRGGGTWTAATAGQEGGLRLMSGGNRSYPDNALDMAVVGADTTVGGTNGGTTTLALPAGAQVGDIAILAWVISSGSFSGITGAPNWNQIGRYDGFGSLQIWWKQLMQADLDAATGGTLKIDATSSPAWALAVYRGGTMATERSRAGVSGGQITVPGFTKRADCKRVVAVGIDPSVTMSIPSGFTSRAARNPGAIICDRTPVSYADGSAAVFGGASEVARGGFLIELN